MRYEVLDLYSLENLGEYATMMEALEAIYAYGNAFGYDHATGKTF